MSDVSAEPEYDYECDVNAMGTVRAQLLGVVSVTLLLF